MNNKGTMFVQKISLYMANPRRFTNLIVPLYGQSRKKNIKDKTIAMIRNQSLFMVGLENVIKNMNLAIHLQLRAAPHIHTS